MTNEKNNTTIVQEINIYDSSYKVTCTEDKREHLLLLAEKLNNRIHEIASNLDKRQIISEKTLFLLAALELEDKLCEQLTPKTIYNEQIVHEVNDLLNHIIAKIDNITKDLCNKLRKNNA